MDRAGIRQIAFAWCLLTAASDGMAQTAGDSSGTLLGTVADQTGGVVAGVTVCVSGPALMAIRCVESDADGAYRFLALPPGEYAVVLTIPGFEPATHKEVPVGPGATTSVPVTIRLAPLAADVSVESSARTLDRFATTRAVRFTAEELAALPGGRSMAAILATAPAGAADDDARALVQRVVDSLPDVPFVAKMKLTTPGKLEREGGAQIWSTREGGRRIHFTVVPLAGRTTLRVEIARWREVAQAANIRLD